MLTTGTGNGDTAIFGVRFRFAPPPSGDGDDRPDRGIVIVTGADGGLGRAQALVLAAATYNPKPLFAPSPFFMSGLDDRSLD
ncbi:hypothetical protein [Sphingopyxis sp. MC1]|uniref:hypothetical protein n=1 Tax=Sphingopyxis sp. MC1 TaxID=1174684 RepID=UPI00058D21C0|nr:hypothetical protein [Sphingopyxis sp. MC1]